MVSTKDHFIYIVHCDYVGEEMWSQPTGQRISFMPKGAINTFTGTEDNWVTWSSNNTITAPAMMTKTDNVAWGTVTSNDDTTTITVVPKELSVTGTWNEFTPLLANTAELSVITENVNTAFVIADQCFATAYRNIETFNITTANTFIDDSDITII